MQCVKQIENGESYPIDVNLTIDKTGKLISIDVQSTPNPDDNEILTAAFGEFPGFIPATIEDVPVNSLFFLNLIVSNDGLQDVWETNDSNVINVSDSAEEMPEFPGGEKAMWDYILSNVQYPVEAQEMDIIGKVSVRFIIERDGTTSYINVVRSVHPLLDTEAVRVIRMMPRWIPGRINGEPVRV